MAITLWDFINTSMGGTLRNQLVEWHVAEGLGTPTIAKRLNALGYDVEQRTVWRWLRDEDIVRPTE
jgi:transposase